MLHFYLSKVDGLVWSLPEHSKWKVGKALWILTQCGEMALMGRIEGGYVCSLESGKDQIDVETLRSGDNKVEHFLERHCWIHK